MLGHSPAAMKTPQKRLAIGGLLLAIAVVVPVAFALWTALGPQSYRAVAVVYVHPFVPTAFDRSVQAASSVGPSASVEQYRSTTLFHVGVVAATPQVATAQADAAAKRMLASLAEQPGDESRFLERPQPPLNPHRPYFRAAMLAIAVSSGAIALAGVVLLVAGLVSRRRERVDEYAGA
jgi:hypothetical protein